MNTRAALAALILTAGTATVSVLTVAPATAGGIGDFLSPAFGTDCANRQTTPHAAGTTTAGTGTANGNLLGLPLGTALNQCGGADAPSIADIQKGMSALNGSVEAFNDLPSALKIQGVSSDLSKAVGSPT